MINWAITIFLLLLVGAFFVFTGGTVITIASLLGGVAVVSSLALLFVNSSFFRKGRVRHTKAGSAL